MAIRDSHYEGRFDIPTPRGVYQAEGDANIRTDYAYRAENMRTERGLLATAYGTSRSFPPVGDGDFAAVETLARFHRRSRPDDPDVYVAAAGGAIYTYTLGTEGWVKRGEGFMSNRWSYVTYEAEEDGNVEDVLIMSNELDGMIVVFGSDLRVEKKALTIGNDYANVKFAVLARHAERIWGAGAIGYPDSVFYSRPYNPFDWTQEDGLPDDSGGMINQPTWDGDSFVALEPFGGYLMAIKQNTMFEVRGTSPSNFTVTQGYGTDGPVQARTICTDRLQTLFLSQGGIGIYDGSTMRLLSRDALYETMKMRMPGVDTKSTACVCDHVYYLALRVKENMSDHIVENNAVVEYDTETGAFMVRTGIRVRDFFVSDGKIYYTKADAPYEIMQYNDPEARGYNGAAMTCMWETAWLDLGKAYRKKDFVLRFTAEADGDDLPLNLTVATDRKERTKTIPLQRGRHDYRVKIQNTGVRVKLRIDSTSAFGWSIHGGIQVEYSINEV